MALSTLGIAEREPQVRRLLVNARQELEGSDARDRPDLEAHRRVGAAVAGNAADVRFALVMEPREVGAGGGDQPAEFLVVKVAGHAETVVPLFSGESSKEQYPAEDGSDDTRRPDCQPAE